MSEVEADAKRSRRQHLIFPFIVVFSRLCLIDYLGVFPFLNHFFCIFSSVCPLMFRFDDEWGGGSLCAPPPLVDAISGTQTFDLSFSHAGHSCF